MSDFKELVKNLYTSKNRELTPEKFDYIQKTYTGKEQDFVKNFYATIGEDLTEEKLNYINDTYLKKKEPSRLQPSATQLPSVGGGFLKGLPELPKDSLKESKQYTSVPKQPKGNQFLDIGTPVTQPQEVRGATVVPKKGKGVIDAPFARGIIQGKIANLMPTGSRPSKEVLAEVAKLNQDLQTLGASDAQAKFEQQGFALFKNEPLKGAEFLLETIGNSLAALAVSGTRTIPAAIGIGAAAGAPIAGIGAAAGAGAGFVAGMSTAGMNLSTSSKVLDVLTESGIDISNEDSLIKGFSDEKLMAKARTKAVKYGIPILIFDAATGGIAGKLTSTAAKATLGKKLLAGVGELGIQGVGAGAGEAGGQYAAEGKIDPTEVALEAIAGTATNIPEIIAGNKIERSKSSSSNKNIAQQISVLGKEAGKEDAIVNLQRDLNNGVIDEKEFNEGVEFVQKAAAIDDKIPKDLQGENRTKSIELIDSRQKLEDELKAIEEQKGIIDVAFHGSLDEKAKEIKSKIDGINKDIFELSKQKQKENAIPKQTAGEVPVQSETTVSEEVEGGKPKTELEETTVIEGNEEKVKPKVNTESLESGGIKYYISDNDGNQVGVAEVSTVDDKIIIDNIFVDEKNKRKGFATSIIDKIIEDFKGRKYEYVDQDNNEFSIPYKIETGTIVSEEGQALSNAVKKKIEDFNKQQESTQSEISQPIELSTEITEEGAPVEEVKLKRQEAEPPTVEGGKKISTISGLTEEERLPLVEERRKKTSLTKKEELHNELSFLAESADKAKGNEKAKLKAEIRQKVRNINAELGDEVYRYDGTSVRVKTKKKGLDVPVYKKVTRTQRDSSLGAIKDDSVLLFDRNPDFVAEYEKLAESPNITSLSVDAGNGKRMTEQQIESALEDIADGIPSVAADNLLNALEEGFNKGYFDLRGKGIGDDSQTIQAMYDEFIGAEQETVTQPMTEEELIKFLEEESKLESEEDIELLDNIENLITEYESEPTKTISKSEIPSTKAKSETTTSERPEPIKSREGEGKPKAKVSGQPDEKTEGKDVAKQKTPPPTPPKVTKEGKEEPFRMDNKSILNRIFNSENISKEVKEKLKDKLKYKVSSQAEARKVAKEIIGEFGYENALSLAESGKFDGDVNSFIFAESLDNAFDKEAKSTTPEEKRQFAEEWKDIAMRYDEAARDKGRFISAIQEFYKKSPLGIVMVEESKRGDLFREWFSKREKPLKEVFEQLIKEPEFQEIIGKEVQEGMKKERAESRKQRRDKIEKFFDDAKFKGNALYAVPIPPKVINGGIEAMKQAFLAGESVVNAVEVAVDYISKQVADWDKEKFRKEYQDKLNQLDNKKGKKTPEELSEEKKEKLLDKFRNKLKGLSEKEKDEVIRKAFKKLVENGALEYNDFKDIIAETLGYGKLTDVEVAKITQLVSDINEVDKIAESIQQEGNRSLENLKKYREAKAKAEKSATELAAIVYNNPDILKRLLSIMQLNTLGIPSLVNNPIFNIVNQAIVRFPIGVQLSVLDQILYGASKVGNKLFNTNVLLPENNIFTSQKEFFKKAGEGSVESARQLINGLTNRDYFQKEVYASQIQPFTSAKDLWDWGTKGKKLTNKQLVDKAIQSTVGLPAEVVARLLNVGDKPQRYAAEGAKASAFAKSMGLDNVDYEYFLEFPKEEAYRYYKNQGMGDTEAMAKAEKTKEAIIKAGEESVFQQDNLVNDALNAVFEATKKYGSVRYGIAQAVKMFNFPYLKIPLNAFWSAYNLVNPEVAFTQSLIYSIKAIKTKDRGDIQKAKMWAAHGATGMALVAIAGSLIAKGIVNADNDDEVSKKERAGEKQYEQQKSINVTKLHALLTGKDPDSVKVGLNVDLKYLAVMGNILNTVAIREERLTQEQKEQREDYLRQLYSNLSLSGLELINNGVFSNASSLLTAIDRGGFYMDSYLLNLINMGTNIVQPAMFAQMSRAQLPYYSKVKADTFYEQLKNNLLARSSVVRELTGKYPPSQVGIWGDKLERKDDFILKWFGMSTVTKDNFAQPIYEDYKRTKNTAFFPPSVKPSINDIKLNTKQAEEFEILVGKERKALIAPYINDLAKFDIIDKRYSELNDNQKVAILEILYKIGFRNAKDKFTELYPEFKKEEIIDEDKLIEEAEMEALRQILGIEE